MGKVLGRMWVGGTLSLISFIGFTSQLFVVLPSYRNDRDRDASMWKVLVPFNLLLFLLFTSYVRTVNTNPGNVPRNWEPDWQALEAQRDEAASENKPPVSRNARFCKPCQAYKPPRTHHCRQCKTCILKMDHHCPWVNNCVGHFNQGHFVRFLFYVDIACAYHLWMITNRAFGITAFQRAPTTFQIVMLILNYTACVPVALIVGVFSLFHFWNVLTNATTIEGWEKDKCKSLKRRGKIANYRYPFDLGWYENLKSVLGENVLTWWLPQSVPATKLAEGGEKVDGLKYKVGKGIPSHEQYLWPPRDEFITPVSRKKSASSRRRQPVGSPFTYGTGLNPALARRSSQHDTPQENYVVGRLGLESENGGALRKRRSRSSNLSISTLQSSSSRSSSPSLLLSDFEGDGELDRARPAARPSRTSERGEEHEEDSDEVPLGSLAARRAKVQNPSRRTRRPSTDSVRATSARTETDRTSDRDRDRRSSGTESDSISDSDEEREEEDEEDLDPNRAVRIRRGSEGYEVKPRFVARERDEDRQVATRARSRPHAATDGEDDWETFEPERDDEGADGDPYMDEMVSEGELDDEGNRLRRGQRYRYYVREQDSESDTDDELEL